MNLIKNIFYFITDVRNIRIVTVAVLFILTLLLFRQCEQTKKAEWEALRISNNWKASKDSIRNFINKDGNSAAEIRALTLTLDEIRDSLIFEKNKPPVTIIKYETIIEEKIDEVPVNVIDTVIGNFNSAIVVMDENSWGMSKRKIKTTIPYSFNSGSLDFGSASIELDQNIWLSASIIRNNKTKEVFVNLETDYPGTTFNKAQGIVIDQYNNGFKDLQYHSRKTLGLGFHSGVGFNGNGIGPYIGIGINYTPKFLQW
jgi:hypothetical protein